MIVSCSWQALRRMCRANWLDLLCQSAREQTSEEFFCAMSRAFAALFSDILGRRARIYSL
jgi:hypothetical protein